MPLTNVPLVSFIIPFYNHNHFVKYTLDSILEDVYPNKEIIIINDGSPNPDDSNIVNWIEDHENNISINYIKRENKGLTKTLNELINLSNGKYIALCASDDYFINNTITKRVEILENNPKKLLLLSDNIVINDNGEKIYDSNLFDLRNVKKKYFNSDRGLKYVTIKYWSLAGACYIVNKDIFKKIGNYNEDLIVEDWDFFLRVVADDLALFYDEKVSAYRIHDNNTISNKSLDKRRESDVAQSAKVNIKYFKSPYFKFILWKKYRKSLKNLVLLKY